MSRCGARNFTAVEVDRTHTNIMMIPSYAILITKPLFAVTVLLSIVREILPKGQIQWDEVVSLYNVGQRPESHRERDALKTKFNRIRTSSGAVADLAQCIQAQIEMAAGVRTGDDSTVCPHCLRKTSIGFSRSLRTRSQCKMKTGMS